MRIAVAVLLVFVSTGALAEPPAPMKDRVKILAAEMRRGPAEELVPFLAPDAPTLSRQYAIRALGRIGDRGKAPEILARLLETETMQLPLALWAAGIAQAESLADPIREHLESENPLVAAAAAEALGWTGARGAAEDIAALLHHPDAHVRAGALRGLARIRPEAMLERLVGFLDAKEIVEREAAEYAVWKTAEERAKVARAWNPEWKGGAGLRDLVFYRDGVKTYLKMDPERMLMVLRGRVPLFSEIPPLALLVDSADPRFVAELIRRIYSDREGKSIDAALAMVLDHVDPKVRRLAAEALGKHGAAAFLRKRLDDEKDLRIRDVLAVELARCGDESAWESIADDPAREELEEVTRLLTRARVKLVSPRKEAFVELCAWLTPTAERRLPAAVVVRTLWEIGEREDPALEPLLRALVLGPHASGDPHVLASAFGVMAENGVLVEETLARWFPEGEAPRVGPEMTRAVAGSLGEISPEGALRKTAERLLRGWLEDPVASPWTRLAARASAEALGMGDVPDEESLPANDWKGLPRPEKPVLGLDLTGDSPWLTEAEILRLADRIAERKPTVAIETTAGTMKLELLPDAAPVHCASLVLSAVRGTYRNTRWHRVVPSFVIQGGDPHGHGAGDAGFTIPDEISPIRYRRGDLGMPKSRKDDGGCQLFLMHGAYPRLDERYTLYGRVTEGLEVLDRIRVGDRIVDVRLE